MTNTAHTGHDGGIQRHSCGEISPWTIVMVGCGFSSQHVYAMNGETGEKLSAWHYSDYGKVLGQHDRSFGQAHRQATRQASLRLLATDSEVLHLRRRPSILQHRARLATVRGLG